MKKLFALLPLALCIMSAQSRNTGVIDLGTLSAVSTTAGVKLSITPDIHTLAITTSGSPASCSIQLEGTLDDPATSTANWQNLSGSQVCTSSVMFHIFDRPVLGIRASLTALGGGATPSVKIKYVGVQR